MAEILMKKERGRKGGSWSLYECTVSLYHKTSYTIFLISFASLSSTGTDEGGERMSLSGRPEHPSPPASSVSPASKLQNVEWWKTMVALFLDTLSVRLGPPRSAW